MQPKSFLASKTIWGVVVAVAPQLINLAISGALGPKAQAAISGIGALLAIYGRAKASQPISVVPPPALPLLPIVFFSIAGIYVGGLLGTMTGCASTNGGDGIDPKLVAQVSVTFGVGKVLQNNPQYAPRVRQIAHEVGLAAGKDASSVSAIMSLARAKIDWTKLSPSDQVLVNTLLVAIESELAARIESGVLSPEKILLVQEVAGWIEDAAILYTPPQSVPPLSAPPVITATPSA